MLYNHCFFTAMNWTREKMGNNHLRYIIWGICRFPLQFFALIRQFFTPNAAMNEIQKRKKSNKCSGKMSCYLTFGCFFRSRCRWRDQIHWHVLIVCKLVKRRSNERQTKRALKIESEKREKVYKLLNVEQICLSDRGKARTQSEITQGTKTKRKTAK